MKKRIFYSLTILLLSVFLLTSCMTTTTAGGDVGADRRQMMLYSEAEMNQSANEA